MSGVEVFYSSGGEDEGAGVKENGTQSDRLPNAGPTLGKKGELFGTGDYILGGEGRKGIEISDNWL